MVRILIFVLSLVWFTHAMPLAKKMIDLTHVFDETTLKYPVFKEFKIDSLVNGTLEGFDELWIQFEEYSSGTHVGTHMDAPSHFIKGGKTIDQLELVNFIAPAAVVDITAKAELNSDVEATTEDFLNWETRTGQSLNGAVILLKTGWSKKWHEQVSFFGTEENDKDKLHFPGISAEACEWLASERTIKGIGTETLSVDNGNSRTFPCHHSVLGRGLYILENVANVDKLPLYGAKLYVFPMKIGKGSGAPTRIVASIPQVIHNLPTNE